MRQPEDLCATVLERKRDHFIGLPSAGVAVEIGKRMMSVAAPGQRSEKVIVSAG
jgi:hypothetical protein